MENKKLANLKFSVIVSMFYYLTLLFMTSSTPPGPYDDSAPLSAFTLDNGQEREGEDVFTPDTVGVRSAVAHFVDKSHLALIDERPPVS